MTLLNANNIVEELLKAFPCLIDGYHTFDNVEKTLLHVLFGQLFQPYIKSVFSKKYCCNEEKIKITRFLERMAASPDEIVRAVLMETVIEELLDDQELFEKIEPWFLKLTKQYSDKIKRAFST